MSRSNVMNNQTLTIAYMDLVRARVYICLNVEIVEIRCHMLCGTYVEILREITRMLSSSNISRIGIIKLVIALKHNVTIFMENLVDHCWINCWD